MTRHNSSRQKLLFDPEEHDVPVTIYGAGGIGGPLALLLAKLGIRDITVVDFDTVGGENLRSQAYGEEDVGKPKVLALRDLLARQTDCLMTPVESRYEGGPVPQGIVIAAVDDMNARKAIWNAIKLRSDQLFIDGRMGGELMEVLTARPCDPDDIAHYEQFLFTNEEASPRKCGAEAIAYCTFGVASLIARVVRGWLTDSSAPRRIVGDYESLTFVVIR